VFRRHYSHRPLSGVPFISGVLLPAILLVPLATVLVGAVIANILMFHIAMLFVTCRTRGSRTLWFRCLPRNALVIASEACSWMVGKRETPELLHGPFECGLVTPNTLPPHAAELIVVSAKLCADATDENNGINPSTNVG